MPTRRKDCVPTAFEALGFPPEEAEHLRIRADLMVALTHLITERGWTQAEAERWLAPNLDYEPED